MAKDKNFFIDAADIDLKTLEELPPELQNSIKYEMQQIKNNNNNSNIGNPIIAKTGRNGGRRVHKGET
eukprot:Awhi_evm2s484